MLLLRLVTGCALVVTTMGALSTTGPADAHPPSAGKAPSVRISAPAEAVEGDQFRVVVHVGSAARAEEVSLQQLVMDRRRHQPQWSVVTREPVSGRSRIAVPVRADQLVADDFRAVVRYADGRRVTSNGVTVQLWHWYRLSYFEQYVASYEIDRWVEFTMAGAQWRGWMIEPDPDAEYSVWEGRYALEHACREMRGTAGVLDNFSDEGSAARITLIADDSEVVWQSPDLVPGTVVPFDIDLDHPEHFAIRAENLTAPVDAWPAIGAPKFLCNFG